MRSGVQSSPTVMRELVSVPVLSVAITVTEPGDADVMTWAEVPDPQPRPGEVLVEVVAAGLDANAVTVGEIAQFTI